MKRKTYLIVLLMPLLAWHCRKQLQPTEVDLAEYGWVLYDEGQFRSANEWFVEAVFEDSTYTDGFNGLGWTYGKIGEIDSSLTNFQRGRTLAFQDTTRQDSILLLSVPPHDVPKETTAGLTFAYHAKNNHVNAVIYGNSLLSMTGDSSYAASQGSPRWTFSRDETVNSKHIIWTLASSQFALGNFEKSLAHVHQLMSDPSTFTPKVNTVEGRRELAEKIEFLRDNL
ncbi:MAG: hypothetical protein ACE5GH_05060 [Fidelibacterota bacterium]